MQIPSQLVHLPVAFDKSQSRCAVAQYAHSIRTDAPNCEAGNNIDYVVRYKGLGSREALYESVLGTEHLNAFIGFFPGFPFLFPLDPRHAVIAPKYNPARTWTPAGALGLGAPAGRSTPWSRRAGTSLSGGPCRSTISRRATRHSPRAACLMRAGDRVRFHRVEESELIALWEDVYSDTYEYRIEEDLLDASAYSDGVAEVSSEAGERRKLREQAAAEPPIP